MVQFKHEELEVYRAAIEFVAFVDGVAEGATRDRRALIDRLKDAAVSVPLGIAEACADASAEERLHDFQVARRAVMECAALLDVVDRLEVGEAEAAKAGKLMLLQILRQLTELGGSRVGSLP